LTDRVRVNDSTDQDETLPSTRPVKEVEITSVGL
jgi:hypothetical protein